MPLSCSRDDAGDMVVVDEEDLISVDLREIMEFDEDAVYGRPSFQVGDVVLEADHSYAVSGVVNMAGAEESEYMYEISSVSSGNAVSERSLSQCWENGQKEKQF